MANTTKTGKSTNVDPRLLLLTFEKIIAGGFLAVLSGCSSLNIGSNEYACPGMPNGVQCMSARDVYAATNDGKTPRPMNPDEVETKEKGDKLDQDPASVSENSVSDEVLNTYVAPRLPNKPVPIRTPAQVMRIWVAPWEDTNGDLIVTGYIYTEIESRRWVIGDNAKDNELLLKPLESPK